MVSTCSNKGTVICLAGGQPSVPTGFRRGDSHLFGWRFDKGTVIGSNKGTVIGSDKGTVTQAIGQISW